MYLKLNWLCMLYKVACTGISSLYDVVVVCDLSQSRQQAEIPFLLWLPRGRPEEFMIIPLWLSYSSISCDVNVPHCIVVCVILLKNKRLKNDFKRPNCKCVTIIGVNVPELWPRGCGLGLEAASRPVFLVLVLNLLFLVLNLLVLVLMYQPWSGPRPVSRPSSISNVMCKFIVL